MNKSDLKLILFVLLTSCVLFIVFKSGSSNYAYVYYDNNLVLEIDLSVDDKYKVEGFNGEVLIEVKDNKLRVYKENSKFHICSHQGFMSSGSIVCLPNKVVISFENQELDAVVR